MMPRLPDLDDALALNALAPGEPYRATLARDNAPFRREPALDLFRFGERFPKLFWRGPDGDGKFVFARADYKNPLSCYLIAG